MSEKTGWFAAETKPVRIGEYETVNCEYAGTDAAIEAIGRGKKYALMRYWDGQHWRFGPNQAICAYQKRVWQGLTEPTKC